MTEQPIGTEPEARQQRARKEHRAKLAFLAVVVIIGVAIYWSQLKGPQLEGWEEDLPAALAKARAEGRPLVLFFLASERNYDTTKMIKDCLPNPLVTEPLVAGKYIPVAVTVDRQLQSPRAKEYEVETLPTLVILSSSGKVLERKGGFTGPAELRTMLMRHSAN